MADLFTAKEISVMRGYKEGRTGRIRDVHTGWRVIINPAAGERTLILASLASQEDAEDLAKALNWTDDVPAVDMGRVMGIIAKRCGVIKGVEV